MQSKRKMPLISEQELISNERLNNIIPYYYIIIILCCYIIIILYYCIIQFLKTLKGFVRKWCYKNLSQMHLSSNQELISNEFKDIVRKWGYQNSICFLKYSFSSFRLSMKQPRNPRKIPIIGYLFCVIFSQCLFFFSHHGS